MPRAKKTTAPAVEEVKVIEEVVEEVKVEEPKKYVVNTKVGYSLNVRFIINEEISRTIPYGSDIEIKEIKDGKAILNDNEFVYAEFIKEV